MSVCLPVCLTVPVDMTPASLLSFFTQASQLLNHEAIRLRSGSPRAPAGGAYLGHEGHEFHTDWRGSSADGRVPEMGTEMGTEMGATAAQGQGYSSGSSTGTGTGHVGARASTPTATAALNAQQWQTKERQLQQEQSRNWDELEEAAERVEGFSFFR